ncbi:MAG: DUF2760 domain-containing protein [Thermoguttaceae bacterium]
MRRIWLAIRAFFVVLFNSAAASRVAEALGTIRGEPQATTIPADHATPPVGRAPEVRRSEAVTLLAALQREARLVDFVQEPLEGYSDAQIGAAARDVHRECGKLFERLFALRPVAAEEEGSAVDIPAGFDAGRWRLVGNVTGQPPFRGRLVHHGWEATACQLPEWSGRAGAARVVAPVEVEIP